MENFKKAQVIMLPTEDKSNICIVKLNDKNILVNNKGYNSQHLYIISNEKIYKDDFVQMDDRIGKVTSVGVEEFMVLALDGTRSERSYSKNELKKIIATTDSKLGLVVDGNDVPMPAYSKLLPQPSQQFIEKYVESYNKGEIITDVLVEYEIKSNSGLGHNEWVYLQHIEGKRYIPIKIEANIYQTSYQLGKEDTFEDYELEYNLKINSKDNTITIKQKKETLKDIMIKNPDIKEEVKQLLIDCCGEVSCEDGKLLAKTPLELIKWIEENL